jgi:thymidine kinase
LIQKELLYRGSIEVITGSMFSGKTEELMRRIRRAEIAKLRVGIFKPAIDNRYVEKAIVSHDYNSSVSTPVENASSMLLLYGQAEVIGIDEAQFFDPELPMVCEKLADKGIRVIVAGLDMDFQGNPFGSMPSLMSLADDVLKLHAVCLVCGRAALYSYRIKSENQETILIGEKERYEPRCRICYNLDV